LASKSGKPILPICHNSGKYWQNKKFIKRPGQVIVKIGAPIAGENAKELTKSAYLWIKNSYREIS
jgi:1-acyl-sn-glycerol-3-phosphate acyltransferase